jgi:hypothetical protein
MTNTSKKVIYRKTRRTISKKMKLMFCHHDVNVMQRLLDRPAGGENVVILCQNAAEIFRLIAATEPHLIVIGGKFVAAPSKLATRLRIAGFQIPIRVMPAAPPNDGQLDDIWATLKSSAREFGKFDPGPHAYAVLAEQNFPGSTISTKKPSPNAFLEENRFLALLDVGEIHNCARRYLEAAKLNEDRCEGDWASAIATGSSKAYLWRTQLFRYVGTLAHYVPGVEIDCLPLPHMPARKLDYLYKALSSEALYGMNAVRSFGINAACGKALWDLGQLQTTEGPQLSEHVMRLLGWTRFLRSVASAHVDIVNSCLTNNLGNDASFGKGCSRNQQRLFGEWWNLKTLITSPTNVRRVVNEFHAGRRASGIPPHESFFDLVDRTQKELQIHPANN